MADRKYLSGSQKRKIKEKRQSEISKCQKLTSFFETQNNLDESQGKMPVHEPESTVTCVGENDHISDSDKDKDDDQINVQVENIDQPNKNGSSEMSLNITYSENFEFNDLGIWPKVLTDEFVSCCLAKGQSFFQNRDDSNLYPESCKLYKIQKRYFSNNCFERTIKNGQKVTRSWLCYSKSKGSIFCFVCKLFSSSSTSLSNKEGTSDWKNVSKILESHEDSSDHKKSLLIYLTRKENKNCIDKNIEEQLRKSTEYYYDVLKRVVAVIKFLCERGMPSRGHEEKWGSPHNGNFMGLIELISEFDPFLKQHLLSCQNRNSIYLSKTIYEEIVEIMGKQVQKTIIDQINSNDTKYYAIIVDSTPDLAHTDQMAIIIRYCFEGQVFERFVTFIKIENHTSRTLFEKIKGFLNDMNLLLINIRGQSYDNAANMSGKYKGLQALVKECNELADYVPCAAHSLNLVGVEAVSVVPEMINFFGIVQQLYVFFSASPHRWELLNKQTVLKLSLKNLSKTRWSAHHEAVRALKLGYSRIINVLKDIFQESREKAECKSEAKNLYLALVTLETAVLTIVWDEVLERFNKVSKKIQSPGLDICEGFALISSLQSFVKTLRQNSESKYSEYETRAKELSPEIKRNYKDFDKRSRTRVYSDGERGTEVLREKNKFRVQVFIVLLDSLIAELDKRSNSYKALTGTFKFLMNLADNSGTIDNDSLNLVLSKYKNDIEEGLKSECIQFKEYIAIVHSNKNEAITCLEMYRLIYEQKLIDTFPNLYTILKIYLTLPVTSCEAERAFSRMAYIKNKYRSTMLDDRLNYLSILSIENDLTKRISYDMAIKEFASSKCRRKHII